MSEVATFLDALVAALLRAGQYNKNDQVPPAAILWPDKECQWEPLLPELRERLPILTLGPYAPTERTGSAFWLRCMLARTLSDDVLPAEPVPIIYLPDISRAEIRAIEECPRSLQPLAELQYRGALWTHKNGRDWTVAGFLQSADGGLGIPISGDAATKEALIRALPKLAFVPVGKLKKDAPLKAAFFDELLNPDQVQRLLLWLDAPTEYLKRLTQAEWYSFCDLCRRHYGFHPVDDGALGAAGRLGSAKGAWEIVWNRYAENPEAYPNLPGLLRKVGPQQRTLFEERQPYWPQDTDAVEEELRTALLALRDSKPSDVRAALVSLESEHGPRRAWVWARLGHAPLAGALGHLADLANSTAKPLGGATVADIVNAYTQWGWRADAAVLDALAAVEDADTQDIAAVKAAILSIYTPWLETAAKALQDRVLTKLSSDYLSSTPLAADAGTCILFSDALRFDAGMKLAVGLEHQGLQCTVGWGLAALPTVTPTAKPAISPVANQMSGNDGRQLKPVVTQTGATSTAETLRKLLGAADFQILIGDELGDPSGHAWTELGAIDQFGHGHGWKIARHLQAELRTIERRIGALIAHGWQKVIVVTDHGWLMLPDGLPKVELQEHLTLLRKGRCAVLKEGADTDQHTVPWHWNKDVRVAVASGIACYEAGKEYEHGGISPQECIVPKLIVVKPYSGRNSKITITGVSWTGLRCSISTSGSGAGVTVDVRTKAGNSATSLTRAKPVEIQATSLLIEDEDQLGVAAFVVLVGADGTLLAQAQTTVGG